VTSTLAFDEFKGALLFLTAAGVIVPLFRRLKVSPVIGFLAAGIALGPFGVRRLASEHHWLANVTIGHAEEISEVAEFGVVFLLFMIGLELSFERLVRMRRILFGLGSVQVAASAVLLGLAAYFLGQSIGASTVLGGALALSSTAIVMPVLADRKRLNSVVGRTSFAVLLFQDLCVAPLLILVGALGESSNPDALAGLVWTIAVELLTVAILVIAGRLVLRPLFHMVAAAGSTEAELRGLAKGAAATEVGRLVAERARTAGVATVVFDRGGYKYHGRVKSLADAARDAGLVF